MTKDEKERIDRLLGFINNECSRRSKKEVFVKFFNIMCAVQQYYGRLDQQIEITYRVYGYLPEIDPKVLEI